MLNHMEGVLNCWTISLSYVVILYFYQQYESSRCSTTLPTLCVINLFNFCLSCVCILVSYCGFSLYISDAGGDWGQEEKGTTEDEMAGWHHWLDGRESGWTSGVGDGQGGLACCDSWGRKESDMTERLNWTELNEYYALICHPYFFG